MINKESLCEVFMLFLCLETLFAVLGTEQNILMIWGIGGFFTVFLKGFEERP